MFTVIGGGFGLYGYLPALLRAGWNGPALLPEKYRPTIMARQELLPLLPHIEWRETITDALRDADAAVIAVPPFAQREYINQALGAGVRAFIIEKPVMPNPMEAGHLLDSLDGVSYRAGYLFLYCDWMRDLQTQIELGPRQVRINWTFAADHFVNNKDVWKRYHSKGGGPLRFYGIHIIAAAAKLGYTEAEASLLSPTTWSATLSGDGLPPLILHVDSHSDRQAFVIDTDWDNTSTTPIQASSPFAFTRSDGQDQRVGLLELVAASFRTPDAEWVSTYRTTNALWERIEARTA